MPNQIRYLQSIFQRFANTHTRIKKFIQLVLFSFKKIIYQVFLNQQPAPLSPIIRKFLQYVDILKWAFFMCLIAVFLLLSYEARQNHYLSEQIQNTGQALMHAQRLAKNVNLIFTQVNSYQEISDSSRAVQTHIDQLKRLQDNQWFQHDFMQQKLKDILPKWEFTQKAANIIQQNQQTLINSNHSYQNILGMDDVIVKRAQKIEMMIKQKYFENDELLTASALSVLSGKLIYSTQRIYTQEVINQDMISEINQDLFLFENNLKKIQGYSQKYQKGSWFADFIAPEIIELGSDFQQLRLRVEDIIKDLPTILNVKQAQIDVLQESEFLRLELDAMQKNILVQAKSGFSPNILAICFAILGLFIFLFLFYINSQDLLNRAWEAQQRQKQAENNKFTEEQKNQKNQKSIVRLMNELQEVANGNLTKPTTVDGGITSAIADSINYTIEELRELVSRVKNISEQVFLAFSQAKGNEEKMMLGVHQQSTQIINVSQSITKIAERIEQLSEKSLGSIELSKKSNTATRENKQATEKLLASIQQTRQYIKESHQLIKRLGERSLEISEVNDFTANLTQQIHILALNAAVIVTRPPQEQSKGLNVIAQEVQKLAERSKQSMEQVQSMIRMIQEEVKDATTAMEKSTQSVVQVSELSEQMRHIFDNMDSTHQDLLVSVQSLIQDVLQESEIGRRTVQDMQDVLLINEQTLENTKDNQQSTNKLTHLIKNLQQSVERFTIQ